MSEVRRQLLLLSLTLMGAALMALGMVAGRSWFVGFVREEYTATTGYEAWMASAGADQVAPGALVAAQPKTMILRAETTLVVGSPEQRLLAVRFLELSRHPRAADALRRARSWHSSRQEDGLCRRLDEALARLPDGELGGAE